MNLQSAFGKLNMQDVVKALRTTVAGAVIIALYTITQQPEGIDLATVDWAMILKTAVYAGLCDLLGRTGTTAEGKFLGVMKVS